MNSTRATRIGVVGCAAVALLALGTPRRAEAVPTVTAHKLKVVLKALTRRRPPAATRSRTRTRAARRTCSRHPHQPARLPQEHRAAALYIHCGPDADLVVSGNMNLTFKKLNLQICPNTAKMKAVGSGSWSGPAIADDGPSFTAGARSDSTKAVPPPP